MKFPYTPIGIIVVLWVLKQGDTCSFFEWNSYSLALRLYKAQNVLIGRITATSEDQIESDEIYRDLTVNISCVLKDTQSLSVKNAIEIREHRFEICNVDYDPIMNEETIIMFRYDVAKNVYELDHVNYEAPQVRATQANLDTALELCGFQYPYVPSDVTYQGTCAAKTTTETCHNTGTAATPNIMMIIVLCLGVAVIA